MHLPRIDVTNGDIRVAKRAWLAAQASEAPQARIDELQRGYAQLVQTQAQQLAEDYRTNHPKT